MSPTIAARAAVASFWFGIVCGAAGATTALLFLGIVTLGR